MERVAASASVEFDIKWKVRRATIDNTFANFANGGYRKVILDGTAEKQRDAGKQHAVGQRARRWDALDLWRDLGQSFRM